MVKVAISNLAWNPSEEDEVFLILNKLQINYLEISPFKIGGNNFLPTKGVMESFIKKIKKQHISIVAIQSILFGHPELTIFGNKLTRKKICDHLAGMIQFAGEIGAEVVVFGSPKNKLKGNTPFIQAFSIAVDFFSELADEARKAGVKFCIEPTPTAYGADFILNTTEAVGIAKKINNDNLKINVDLGALTLNNEDPETVILNNIRYIGHIHISEPYLGVIKQDDVLHKKMAATISKSGYNNFVSIEMLKTKGSSLRGIDDTLTFVKNIYGN